MTFGNACGGKRLESLKHAVLFLLHGFRLMQRVTRLPPPPSFFAYPRFRVCFQRMKVYSKLLFMNGKMCVCLVCHCISFLTQHQGKAKTASPHTHTSTPSSNKTEQNTKDQNNHSGVILDGRVFIPGFFCFVFPLTQRIISLVCELFFK